MKTSKRRNPRNACFFGVELTKMLLDKKSTQRALALEMGKFPQWISDMVNGGRSAPPTTVDTICSILQLDEQSRYRLHIAAARDCGYKIPVFL